MPLAMHTLYIVATPIGNLEDITQRAIRILNEVGLIAAEDTRRTRKLLNALGIKTSVTSYHEQGKKSKIPYILECLVKSDVALVSEAGMPGISDPGYNIVREAINQGIDVVAIPGPSVLPTALAISGLPCNQFTYLGFLPRKKGERQRILESVAKEKRTIVVFEAPHRITESLNDILDTLGNRDISVCRELTKVHEEIFRGSVEEAIAHFSEPRGEFTLVISGHYDNEDAQVITESIYEELQQLRDNGFSAKDAVAQVSKERGLNKRAVYKAWLELT